MNAYSSDAKICFISSRGGFFRSSTEVMMDWSNGRVIDKLNDFFGSRFRLAIFSDPEHRPRYDLSIRIAKGYELPFPFSHSGGFVNTPRIVSIFRRIQRENDVLIVQLPIIGFFSLLTLRRPAVYHLCANVFTATSNPVKYKGLMKPVASGIASVMDFIYKRCFAKENVRLIVNGSELGRLYSEFNPAIVVSSGILDSEVYNGPLPADRTGSAVPRILFFGRPSLEKGMDILIEVLLGFTRPFTLTVVGFSEEEFKKMLPDWHDRAEPLRSMIEFRGELPWTDDLREMIREQDVLIVPSRSEGTPRVILECMSQGVPAIASDVGGIPDVVEDDVNGLLFKCGNPANLLSRLNHYVETPGLKEKFFYNALSTARKNTVDDFVKHFISNVEELIND